jgi:hypothetical protein
MYIFEFDFFSTYFLTSILVTVADIHMNENDSLSDIELKINNRIKIIRAKMDKTMYIDLG